MANKDFYDRIADALEIISGDDSHVDDVDKNMDYYKRIAEALENIAQSGGSGGGSSSSILTVTMSRNGENQWELNKTFKEIVESDFAVVHYYPMGQIENNPYYNIGYINTIMDIPAQNLYSMDITIAADRNIADSYSFYVTTREDYPTAESHDV